MTNQQVKSRLEWLLNKTNKIALCLDQAIKKEHYKDQEKFKKEFHENILLDCEELNFSCEDFNSILHTEKVRDEFEFIFGPLKFSEGRGWH